MEIIQSEEKLYEVKKKIPKHNFKNKDEDQIKSFIKQWREYLGYSKTLQSNTHFIFANIISDVEFEDVDVT
jgi:hypothetical protein